MRFDLHSHIVPGIDDGAGDEDSSRKMIEAAKADGIGVIAATSHYSEDAYPTRYEEAFPSIRSLATEMGVRLLRGCEYDLRYLEHDQQKTLQRLEGTDYLLVDMNQNFIPPSMKNLFFKLKLTGAQIIFAHPERMLGHEELGHLLTELAENGIYIQVDTGSVVGRFGHKVQKNAFQVLDAGVCHLLANDAHSEHHFCFSSCREILDERYGTGNFELLTEVNPERLFARQLMEPLTASRKSFFQKLFHLAPSKKR